MSEYTGTVDRFFLFCKVQQVNAGNALAANWDFDTGGSETFGNVLLSNDGQLPATHYGASTAVDDGMNQGITNAITQGTPWLTGYKEVEGWTWEMSLADIGLKIIVEE